MATILVEIEGQQVPVDEEIAQDDNLLKQLFRPYYPDVANARIDRKEGEIIKVIKVAGPKGLSPLEILLDAPEAVNPAIQMCRVVQQRELLSNLDYTGMEELASEIEATIQQGIEEVEAVDRSLTVLQKSSPVPGALPTGF